MIARFVVLLLLTFCVFDSMCRADDTPPTWYVSPEGNDTWSGRLVSPNAEGTDGTLAQAVVASRKAGTGPRRIVVLPGEHAVAETIELTDADCGLAFEGTSEQRPLIHGGRALTKWRRDEGEFWAVDVPEAKDGTCGGSVGSGPKLHQRCANPATAQLCYAERSSCPVSWNSCRRPSPRVTT